MKTIIFDFDGTIADSMHLVRQMADDVLPFINRPNLSDDDIENMRKMTIPQGMKYMNIPVYQLPKIVLLGRQSMKRLLDKLPLIKGMDKVIKDLHKNGHVLGIVTSNSAENVESFLRTHDLRRYFSFIDAGVGAFNKSRKLKSSLKKHKLSPDECLYVGDEIRDVQAAHASGMAIAAVSWGVNHPDVLVAHKPEFMVDSPVQLIEIAQKESA